MWFERLSSKHIADMRRAGRVAAATLAAVAARLRPGVSTKEIDRFVREDTARRGATPSQLGYHGFPAAVCTSRNDVACHGVPRADERLVQGDLISVDVTSCLGGWHGDTCGTFPIGELSPERRHVLEVARRCRDVGTRELRDGVRLGDVGAAVEALAHVEGCSVVREVGGHGIGRAMHLPPHVAHFGVRGRGRRLRAGMALTIEPILVLGRSAEVHVDADGWTMRTAAGAPSAQFEHTVVITRDGAEILTVPG